MMLRLAFSLVNLCIAQICVADEASSLEIANAAASLPKNCLRVPEEHATIQAAVDAAPDGATVLIAPGVYHEAVHIGGKSVSLASWFLTTRDPRYIKNTVLDGSVPAKPDAEDDDDGVRPEVILIAEDAGTDTTILGLTIRDGDDGIACHAKVHILHNYFVNNTDAIDYEGGGGECRFNRFVANDDDAVDFDEASEGTVADNEILDNDDDGIEIRLHPYRGQTLRIVIRDNVISGNGEDGIQIIDYPEPSDRAITIERNVIANNAMAGIGCMADANSRENYEGASIPEAIAIINNTICGNQYGITGGGHARVMNNIICHHQHTALKNVAGQSVITHNLLWANGQEAIGCNVGNGVVITADPRLDDDFRPDNAREIVDAGTVWIESVETPWVLAPIAFHGLAPDLGAYEAR
jgi:hypothetical protein